MEWGPKTSMPQCRRRRGSRAVKAREKPRVSSTQARARGVLPPEGSAIRKNRHKEQTLFFLIIILEAQLLKKQSPLTPCRTSNNTSSPTNAGKHRASNTTHTLREPHLLEKQPHHTPSRTSNNPSSPTQPCPRPPHETKVHTRTLPVSITHTCQP